MTAMTVPAQTYSLTARTLHWITATLVLINLPLGLVIANIWDGPLKDWLYDLHRSIGATVIPVILLRFLYRLTHRPPPLPADMPPVQQLAAHATHWLLYGLLIVQPFLGWIGTSAFPAQIVVFGLFQLPSIWPEDRAFSDLILTVHAFVALAIACLVVGHIGAALYHHYVRKDGILARMLTSAQSA
jgi:cytochrome b561